MALPSVELSGEEAVTLLELLDPLAGGGLLAYGGDPAAGDLVVYDGPAIPEARRLGERIKAALAPAVAVGDVVRASSGGREWGELVDLALFRNGWQAIVLWERSGSGVNDAEALIRVDNTID